ncbi:glycosyl hydrolase 53 family protein [Paenibacillus maysiensis]|uniref:glycosyl hydrolase 53 family protein n=1 Tax=Paenibacillus maysiensis TaxID=1155954 RepID=UPI000472AD02|nr:glycosyl hydrolase 53 family protein [Paenibacillus maysiensis]
MIIKMKSFIRRMKKRTKIILSILIIIAISGGFVLGNQLIYIEDKNYVPAANSENFRLALSVSPFSGSAFNNGYTYSAGELTATNREELEKMYIAAGATEMYARIATKRYPTKDNLVNGEEDSNANYHTLEQGLELARLAAKLKIPLNPEIMGAYTYMDMERQQAPNFEEYPEIYALQKGKPWEELSLDEMDVVLKAYGKFVATEILKTGATVENWNIGNEANFGFAGVNIGLKTAVNEKLQKVPSFMKYMLPIVGTNWLKNNVWKYNAVQMTAVANGIKSAYTDLGLDSSNIKFSTHIATVVSTVHNAVAYFNTLKENGFPIDVAGISFYPSAPGVYIDKMVMYKKIVTAINEQVGLPVFIAEFSYPSGKVEGPFAGWSKTVKGYPHNEEGQAAIYHDVIAWGKTHGLAGIRYWAPDYRGWGSMSMFDYTEKGAKAKSILVEALQSKTPEKK